MKCPVDSATLVMSDKQGIEIDYCPECRGVWLDRGELDKIIERSQVAAAPTVTYDEPRRDDRREEHYREERRDNHDRNYDHSYHKKHKRKENFLGDLFDF